MRLEIDWLRENSYKIHAFGLGFIQVKIDPQTRLHFYYPKLLGLRVTGDKELHNHRYDFISHVLMGQISQQYYDHDHLIRDNSPKTHMLELVSCDPNKPAPEDKEDISLYFHYYMTTTSGWSYFMPHNRFHRVWTNTNTITYLLRGQTVKDFASVIRPIDIPKVCPFSVSMSEDECWQVVDELIKEKNALSL